MPESDKNLNPYQAGEVLVFKSNENEFDTIKVLKVTDGIFPDGPGPMRYYNEHLSVFVEHTDPNNDRSLQNSFLEISTGTPEKATELNFKLLARNAVFYDSFKTIDELDSIEPIVLRTPLGEFSDVLVINDTKREYFERDNFVERIYWSKSAGYLKFDKKDGKTWELVKKYVP